MIKFRDWSISSKFTIGLLSFIIIPLCIIFLIINQSVSRHIKTQNYRTNLEILKQTKTSVDNLINDVEFVSLSILGNENLQSYIKLYERNNLGEAEKRKIDAQYDIQSLLSSRKYISSLSVYNLKSIALQFGGLVQQEDIGWIEVLDELEGRVLWTPAYYNQYYVYEKNHQYEVAAMRTINDLGVLRKKIAYQRINIPEEYICSLYKGIANEGTMNMFIVDALGNIVSSIDKALLGQNIGEKEFFKYLDQESEGYFELSSDQLVSYYTLESNKWYVVKVDMKNYIYREIKIINFIIMTCVFFVVLFGICFLNIQRKSIIVPVEKLSKQVSHFREGSYDIASYSQSKDEIGTLIESFREMGMYIQDLIERVYKSQLREKEAELKSLQSQINPHFLYNSLDSIRWMAIKSKQYEIAEQIEALSNLFRHCLNGGKEITTIGEEIAHLKDYITIQKNRFGAHLKVDIEVDHTLSNYQVLKLILQPLVENAIVHGLEGKVGGGHILVKIEKKEQTIRYSVEDDGLGVDEKIILDKLNNPEEYHQVFALSNLNERIKHKYGTAYGIVFKSQIGIGTTVEVIIPLIND